MAKNKQSPKKPVNTQCISDNADLCASAELVRNGGPIDWRYWSARREITPQEAAKLAHCIDPIQWPDDQHAQGPILNDLHIKIQRLAALLAERNQKWTLIDLAAMLGNNAPLFMREIANLAQQAGDRCNAGIQASKAPPPITPVGDSPLKLPQFDTNVKGSPNWKHWRHVSTVEIWQGLLLSLNIEPPGNGWLIDNAVGGTGDIPYEYLDSHGLTDEFFRRLNLVCNRLETLYASKGAPRKAELTNFLRLPLFAAWAVEFEWDELPPELVALAQSSDKQTDAPTTAKVESVLDTSPSSEGSSGRGEMTGHKQRVEQLQQVREAEADTLMLEEKYSLAHEQAAFDETGLNGNIINWRYWVQQMPILSALHAACLMSGLEPDLFANLNERPGNDDPTEHIKKARKIQRLAEAQGKLTASPVEWVEWAKAQGINAHTGFLLAVWELPEETAAGVDTPAAAKVEVLPDEGRVLIWWRNDYDIMLLAQNAGDSLRRKDERVSNRKIGDVIALRIEQEEKRGKKRKAPDGRTIGNTALKGWKYIAE